MSLNILLYLMMFCIGGLMKMRTITLFCGMDAYIPAKMTRFSIYGKKFPRGRAMINFILSLLIAWAFFSICLIMVGLPVYLVVWGGLIMACILQNSIGKA